MIETASVDSAHSSALGLHAVLVLRICCRGTGRGHRRTSKSAYMEHSFQNSSCAVQLVDYRECRKGRRQNTEQNNAFYFLPNELQAPNVTEQG
ncbi:hypothetical protein GJAV_G00149210 [Gymnothorax javanicus]|nr:hypothetical protein GJAV_G00149210 [Gymnothorax javanicus]